MDVSTASAPLTGLGLPGHKPDELKSRLTSALCTLTDKVTATLERAIDDLDSVEVATYVADDLHGVRYDPMAAGFTGDVRLQAVTRIRRDRRSRLDAAQWHGRARPGQPHRSAPDSGVDRGDLARRGQAGLTAETPGQRCYSVTAVR
jgi:hypothetical protein